MEAPIFESELQYFMSSKNCVDNDDFFEFTKRFYILTKKVVMVKKKQNPYIHVVKKWIAAFQIIFGKSKVTAEMLEYMSKFCSVLTVAFLRMAEILGRYEPFYCQEFYCHWGEIISTMTASKRTASFVRYAVHFEILITHLRTAINRCNQIATLNVLILYIQHAPLIELKKLSDVIGGTGDNFLMDNLQALAAIPSNVNRNDFLYAMNYIGCNILSFKPSKTVCESLQLDFTVSEYEMWIDFNFKEKSLMFVAVSKTTDVVCCSALVAFPELREYVNYSGDYNLTMKGPWTILEKERDPFRKVVSFTAQFPIDVRSVIWKPFVRSIFKVMPKTKINRRESKSTTGTSRVRVKKRSLATMIHLSSSSYSSSEYETQSKMSRKTGSVLSMKPDYVFDKLKHSVSNFPNLWHRSMETGFSNFKFSKPKTAESSILTFNPNDEFNRLKYSNLNTSDRFHHAFMD